jgi:hypothetical protein
MAWGSQMTSTAKTTKAVRQCVTGLTALMFLTAVASPATGQVLERDGDLRAEVFARLIFSPRDSDRYCVPTREALEVWRQAVDQTVQGNLTDAADRLQTFAPCPPSPPSYKVVRYTDTPSKRLYHLLVEVDDDLNPMSVTGWGTYVFDPDPARQLSIEVPHPIADRFTERQGVDAFMQLRPRSLLLAGTHRCASLTESPCTGATPTCGMVRASDAPHGATPEHPTVTNAFQIVHEVLFAAIPRTVYIQLHGNASCSADVLLSNTDSEFTVVPGGNIERLQSSLEALVVTPTPHPALSFRMCSSGQEPACDLCGTNNVQGRWTNGSVENACQIPARALPAEQFIHIEQTLRMREEDQEPRDPPLHQVLIRAIENTIFTQE